MNRLLFLFALVSFIYAAEWSQWRTSTVLQFESGYLNFHRDRVCSNDSLKKFLHCAKDSSIAYYSFLDTDYVVYVFKNGVGIWGIHDEVEESYQYKERLTNVMEYEFMNLQKWNILDISMDSASHLINRVLSEMSCVPDSSLRKGSIIGVEFTHKFEMDKDSVLYCSAGGEDGGSIPAPAQLFELLPELLQKASLHVIPFSSAMRACKIGMKTFYINDIKNSESFMLYDLNGVLLNRGLIKNGIVSVKKIPAILEISNKRFLLK
ncbi:hypothetical protein [uncultured Fibrobacter sp.]|uniref:hypothetical protein n=1 Tax=uncultured Fibrobacter sp. TaxID=261512 RepID=UPI00262DAF17|nr:hypothetical protein [uncultured Fibrobacter sp.]